MRDKKMLDAISKHGRPCLSTQFLNTEKRVENTARSGVFLTNFEVFGTWFDTSSLLKLKLRRKRRDKIENNL